MSSFWDSLPTPWQACLVEAWDAFQAGTIPIGAVVTGAGGEIVARGRNRILGPPAEGMQIYHHQLAHAEINALLALPHTTRPQIYSYQLYTTTEPCPLCLGAWYMSGLRTLHFASREAYAGSTNLLGKTPYLSIKPVRVFGPENLALEAIITALAVEFELRTRGLNAERLVSTWAGDSPAGVELGQELARSGRLLDMARDQQPIQTVIDRLSELLPTLPQQTSE